MVFFLMKNESMTQRHFPTDVPTDRERGEDQVTYLEQGQLWTGGEEKEKHWKELEDFHIITPDPLLTFYPAFRKYIL